MTTAPANVPHEDLQHELEIVQRTEAGLSEASALVDQGHPDMGVVRAVSAFEVFAKQAFVEAYFKKNVLGGNASLAKSVADTLLRSNAWRQQAALEKEVI